MGIRTQLAHDVRKTAPFRAKPQKQTVGEIVLRDERAVIPIGSFNRKFGVTLSLPSVIGRHGVIEILDPDMSIEERQGLERCAASLKQALDRAA
jgi:L-lactate dehydrogenase